jgi:hypothetical protein
LQESITKRSISRKCDKWKEKRGDADKINARDFPKIPSSFFLPEFLTGCHGAVRCSQLLLNLLAKVPFRGQAVEGENRP